MTFTPFLTRLKFGQVLLFAILPSTFTLIRDLLKRDTLQDVQTWHVCRSCPFPPKSGEMPPAGQEQNKKCVKGDRDEEGKRSAQTLCQNKDE